MEKNIPSILCGFALIILGGSVMLGWWFGIPELVRIKANLVPIFFNSALCFFVSGIILILSYYSLPSFRRLQILLSIFIITFSAASLIQDIFAINLGIDLLLSRVWLTDYFFTNPGRMTIITAIEFILAGFAFIFLSFSNKRACLLFAKILAFLVLLMSLLGLLGYILKIEYVFGWYQHTRIELESSLGFIILSMGLWLNWHHNEKYLGQITETKISIISGFILLCIAMIAGLSGFAVMAQLYEDSLKNTLRESLRAKISTFENEVSLPWANIYGVINNKKFQENMIAYKKRPEAMQAALNLFLEEGFSAVRFTDKSTKEQFSVGAFVKPPYMETNIETQYSTKLLWNEGVFAEVSRDIVINQEFYGTLVVEWPLYNVDTLVKSEIGETGEFVVCKSLTSVSGLCLPSRLSPQGFYIRLEKNDNVFPLRKAFSGTEGILMALDYRNQYVIAAYAPIGHTGLVAIAKIDVAEVFAPVYEKLKLIVPLLFLAILIGVLLLYWQVVPLIRKVLASDRKTAEFNALLQESEDRMRAIAENMGEGLITINEWGLIESFNKSVAEIFEYKETELLNNNITKLIYEDSGNAAVLRSPNHYFNKEDPENIIGKGTVELKGLRKGNFIFPMELSVNEVKIKNSKIYTVVVRDISERKKIENMKNEFISMVSHELRTPLTSIRGSLGLLLSASVGEIPEKAKKLLHIAEQNSERLIRLINDILDIEKIESGRMEFRLHPVEMDALVHQSIVSNQSYAEKYQVTVELKESLPGTMVYGDSDRLLQVLDNLISNAAKFSTTGGVVSISVLMINSNTLRVSVKDCGTGIPEEFQSRIFQRFAQADASSTRAKGGTGLGLSISKAIIEKLHGKIGFNTKQGEGTEFYFELPIWREKAVTQSTPKTPKAISSVLICEDDQDVANLLKIILEQNNFETVVVGTAEQAKEELRKRHFDAMTLDLILPDQDGISLIKELRSTRKITQIPIIIISVKAEAGKLELNGNAFTVVDWVSKPIDSARLRSAIQAMKHHLAVNTPHILHIEDDYDVAQVVADLLEDEAVIVNAATLQLAKEELTRGDYNLVILDLALPDGSGLELLPELGRRHIPVIVFSSYDLPPNYTQYVMDALVKSRSTNKELLELIRSAITVDES